MDIMLPEYKKMLTLLTKHKVEFMLIGGYAVIFHGYERLTTDMDIWLKPDNTNRDKLLNALQEFGIKKDDIEQLSKISLEETAFFHFGDRPLRIDFITKVNGVTYAEADNEKKMLPINKEFIPVINYHHLILTKMTTGRSQDKADIEMLQKINQLKN